MKISTKTRYAIASLIILAENVNENKNITTTFIANKLEISKLYLEQIFSVLKRAKLVVSEKGFQGGYRLAKDMNTLLVSDIMRLFETNLFVKTDSSFSSDVHYIDETMKTYIWDKLDYYIEETLKQITLADLLKVSSSIKMQGHYMYYI